MISCIMPTYDRHEYMLRSIKYFLQQDYENKELIIIDDSPLNLKLNHIENNIKYIHLPKKLSIGTKRNIGVQNSGGSIIMFWDDDDIYSKDRMSIQVKQIIQDKCDISVFTNIFYYFEKSNKLHITDDATHKQIWYNGYACGTLTFKKSIWEKCKFKKVNIAEDVKFLKCALKQKYRLKGITNKYKFIYSKHSTNTFKFDAVFKAIKLPDNIKHLLNI